MTALFVVVFIDQWRSTKRHESALIGLVCSVVCLIIFGADNFIIPSMLAIALILSISRKWLDKAEDTDKRGECEK